MADFNRIWKSVRKTYLNEEVSKQTGDPSDYKLQDTESETLVRNSSGKIVGRYPTRDEALEAIREKNLNEESREDELVKVYVKTSDGKWRVLFEEIPESQANAIWNAVFKTGKNLISIENKESRRVKEMNEKTMNKSKKED